MTKVILIIGNEHLNAVVLPCILKTKYHGSSKTVFKNKTSL